MKEFKKKPIIILKAITFIFLTLLTPINFCSYNNLEINQYHRRNEETILNVDYIQYPNDLLDVDVKNSYVYKIQEYFNDIFSFYKFENNVLEWQGYIEDPFKDNRTFGFLHQIEIQDDFMYILGNTQYNSRLARFYVAEFLANHSINVLAIHSFNATDGYQYTNRYQNLIVNDNYAYIGTTWGKNLEDDSQICHTTIIDLDNKSKPIEISNYTVLGVHSDLVVENNKLFLLIEKQRRYNSSSDSLYYFGENQLVVLDILNKSNPVKIQHLNLTSRPCSVAINNNYLYISYHESTLEIYDIEDLENLVLVKSTNIESRKVVFKEDLTYILENEKLIILDTTNINNFGKIGEKRLRFKAKKGKFHDCVVEGNHIYGVRKSFDYGSFIIFDCSNKENPKIVYPDTLASYTRNRILLIIFGYVIPPVIVVTCSVLLIRLSIHKKLEKKKGNNN